MNKLKKIGYCMSVKNNCRIVYLKTYMNGKTKKVFSDNSNIPGKCKIYKTKKECLDKKNKVINKKIKRKNINYIDKKGTYYDLQFS